MIDSLINELRQMADGQATFRDARELMLQAADTIWQLRDDLQHAVTDGSRLHKQGYNDGYAEGMRDAGLERKSLHDMYYAEGYSDGYNDAHRAASLEMKRLRNCLHAILDRGEAPEHVMSDEERTTDARSVPHHL